ncbi:hypothetical protein PYCCODRAFT_1356579 [Trametes coccinea BRFM310]|uniref:Protein kinase domain-containing protein n=1 Tax=Trametes coccinea (strain BRFM310) TaxID=1353009 RepID=A0A1Y2J4T3_TRAC3|nr:hypothetical protein PYCCODRAFT_1356579 [Trametes coccinea BRFM310]
MAQRRSNHRTASLPNTAILSRRKLHARRATNARRRVLSLAEPYLQHEHSSHASDSSPPSSSRPVLVPLHFNLRRLPSRTLSDRKDTMRDAGNGYDVSIGMKRKRVVSGSENGSGPRGARSTSRAKRRRAMSDSSDEEHASGMDVDEQDNWEESDNSDDDGALDSSDSYLINEAPPRRLLRLRKDELVRLYTAAGLTEDAELLTKPEIVDCIIAARDDVAELPPSSPGVGDSGSSDYSSDGGNVAGGEETDFGHRFRTGLRRRATLHDLGRVSRRHMPDRCLSMSHIQHQVGDLSPSHGKRRRGSGDLVPVQQPNGTNTRRRGASNASSTRSSPTTSMASGSLPSPPATRLRTRKASGEIEAGPSSSTSKGRGKGKHVGFSESVQVSRFPSPEPEESDLTDLTEVESSLSQIRPSPRRLRSKGSVTKLSQHRPRPDEGAESARRVTPMRKAKGKIGNLHESTDEEGNEEDELLSSDPEGDDVDELDESPSPMATPKAKPVRGRQTPVKNRLRARHLQTHTPPSDGDDEDSEEEGTVVAGDEGDDEGSGEDEEETVLAEPRVLRNGKVVGEGDVEEDIDDDIANEDEDEEEGEEGEEDEEGAEDSESTGSTADEAEDDEGEESDEAMEDDVDLTVATAKTLVRLRRDDLVRLCEMRDIDPSGTKPQLAQALLEWRDRHASEAATSPPSSTGTARPPSTARVPRRRKTRSKSGSGGRASATPPVLLRSHHVHMDEPRTPPLSGRPKEKEGEGELELDLESLGLEDREIPPDKLTKLEKIGSGGFKDVFIGKFKGRRVAIAEFRGQLSAMDIKELKLLGDFDHPNIVRFLGVSIPENTRETPVMIVSELCSNGDLFDYVRNVNPPSLYRALSIMLDIARGLEYLHTRKPSVIHRDCKSSNILITSKGVAKITDFGLAKVKESTRSMVRSVVGTVNWQAPELWHPHPKYNHKVDVFSCAMVYWEILQWHNPNKKYPWEGMNEHAIYDAVGAKKQRPSVSGLRKLWCPEIVDLVERMWQQDPQDRPTMSEVVHELEQLVRKYR